MDLNKLTYKQIQEIMNKICLWNDNKKYIELFSILNLIKENSSYTYKELLNSKIKSK